MHSGCHLVDGQAMRLHSDAICHHTIAGVKQQDVAHDHIGVCHEALVPAAQRLDLHEVRHGIQRMELAVLLPVVAGRCTAPYRLTTLCFLTVK